MQALEMLFHYFGSLLLAGFLFFYFLTVVPLVAGRWLVFQKGGYYGALSVVPIVGAWVRLRLAGLSVWWLGLYVLPGLGWLMGLVVDVRLAKQMHRSGWVGLGLWLFPFVYWPYLGFGEAAFGTTVALAEVSEAEPSAQQG